MATTSHIRLSCIAAQSGAYCSVAEVEVSASASGTNLCTGGTASGTNNYYSPTLAFNGVQTGSSTTAWAGTLPATLQYSFSAPVNIDFLRIYDPDTNDGQALKDFDIQVSDDGTTWVTARQIRGKVYSSTPTEYKIFVSVANLSCPMQTVSASGGPTVERGNINLVAPVGTLSAFGGANFVPMLAPKMSLAAFGGATAVLTGTFPTLSANGHNSSGENAFAGVAPMASLVFAGGANANLTAPRPVLSVSARFTTVGKANLKAPAPLLAATGTVPTLAKAALSSPMASLVFLGGGNAQLMAASPVLTLTGRFTAVGKANFTAPKGILQASGTVPTLANAALTSPMASLVFSSGASAKLTAPSPALTITGTVTGWGSAALAAPSSQLTASGTTSAVGSAALVAPMASVIGYSGAVCSITLTGKPTLQATGTSGGVGHATLTCPLFELTASGTRQNVGQANLIAPSPRMGATAQAWLIAPGAVLTAIGTAVVTATYEAYSVNLKHAARAGSNEALIDEVTRYTNFPFDRIVRYQNSYFGVAADGLYLLEGTTDDGAAIACTVKTHISDFDAPEKKTVVSAHIGGRFGPTATVTLHVGETGQTAYSYTTPRGQLAQNYREKFGRGIKDRYFGLEVTTTGALEIDQLELEINKLTRRI